MTTGADRIDLTTDGGIVPIGQIVGTDPIGHIVSTGPIASDQIGRIVPIV